jgi:hypothetical protein
MKELVKYSSNVLIKALLESSFSLLGTVDVKSTKIAALSKICL